MARVIFVNDRPRDWCTAKFSSLNAAEIIFTHRRWFFFFRSRFGSSGWEGKQEKQETDQIHTRKFPRLSSRKRRSRQRLWEFIGSSFFFALIPLILCLYSQIRQLQHRRTVILHCSTPLQCIGELQPENYDKPASRYYLFPFFPWTRFPSMFRLPTGSITTAILESWGK